MSRICGGGGRRQRVRPGRRIVADGERGPGRGHRVVRPAGGDRGAGCGGRPCQAAGPRLRRRGVAAGIAAAQLAGEDFLTGLDRQRADAAGQLITPVPGLASTTAAGLARRVTPAQWRAVESGLAVVTGRMVSLLPAAWVHRLACRPGHDRPGRH